jgi:hypothetical protein
MILYTRLRHMSIFRLVVGGTDVTVRATDPGGLWDEDTFRVAVTWSCPGPWVSIVMV